MPEELKPPEQGGTFIPVETYQIRVVIGSLDYTSDLFSATLKSSLSTGYQIMDLVFSIDPNDIIVEQIYGGQEIKVAIMLLRENAEIGPRIDLDLMMIKMDFQLNEKETQSTTKQKDRGYLFVRTVVRPAYTVLSSLVNDVFLETTLNSIISQLALSTGAKIEYDIDGQNTTKIDQVCIPPTTLYKIIKEYDRNNPEVFDGFLDQRFGLFDGVPAVFCQYDKTIQIKNLTSRMNQEPTAVVYQLAIDTERKRFEDILGQTTDGRTFYTYATVQTDYSGNAKFASLATDINHIVKPKNALSQTINQNLEEVAQKYGLIYQNQNIFKDVGVDRKKYYNEDTGYETESTIFNSRFSRQVADLATISIQLERNLPIHNLLQVGDCIDFRPLIVEYMDLAGKYILWSTNITFTRPNIWTSVATINLVRTNKVSGQTIKPGFETLQIQKLKTLELSPTANESFSQFKKKIEAAERKSNQAHIKRLQTKLDELENKYNMMGCAEKPDSLVTQLSCKFVRKEILQTKAQIKEAQGLSSTAAVQEAFEEAKAISIKSPAVKVAQNKQPNVKPFQERTAAEIQQRQKEMQEIKKLQELVEKCEEMEELMGPTTRGECNSRVIYNKKKRLKKLLEKQKS